MEETTPPSNPATLDQIRSGLRTVADLVNSAKGYPYGASRQAYSSVSAFNRISQELSHHLLNATKLFMDAPDHNINVNLKSNDEELNVSKLREVNDFLLDRVNINMDIMTGVRKPDEMLPETYVPPEKRFKSRHPIDTNPMDMCQEKPQLKYKDIIVDNSSDIFTPKLKVKENSVFPFALTPEYDKVGAIIGYENPYKQEIMSFNGTKFYELEPELASFKDINVSDATMVNTEEGLNSLVTHLSRVKVFAVDVEHHEYRTYMGLTCLVQITTVEGGNFIVDPFAIWQHMPRLNLVFSNPSILKIFHGATNDILWLQRDFGIYVVGMLDTFVAGKILAFPTLSLSSLIKRYCNITIDKQYQRYDWRVRPLPVDVLNYAITDTHYLIHIYQSMKKDLFEKARGQNYLVEKAFNNSKITCCGVYQMPNDAKGYRISTSHLTIRQRWLLHNLTLWRNTVARQLDESPVYILDKSNLFRIVKSLPKDMLGTRNCIKVPSSHPLLQDQNLAAILDIVVASNTAVTPSAVISSTVTPDVTSTIENAPHDLVQDLDQKDERMPTVFDEVKIGLKSDEEKNDTPFNASVKLQRCPVNSFLPPFIRYQKYFSIADTIAKRKKNR